MALQMIGRGDVYYANLLLDTPQVGILDLKDMAKDSAEEWVKARATLKNVDHPKAKELLAEVERRAGMRLKKSWTCSLAS